MCNVTNSKARTHIEETWLGFASDTWNLMLILSINGFNPILEILCQWSTWPMYNLPPWLTTKWFFMMVALLIMGKESVNMTNTNTLLCPLVDELMMFWRLGVHAMDFGKPKARCSFTLCGISHVDHK